MNRSKNVHWEKPLACYIDGIVCVGLVFMGSSVIAWRQHPAVGDSWV